MEGRVEMLSAIFGGKKDQPKAKRGVTPEAFEAFAERHNARLAARTAAREQSLKQARERLKARREPKS